MPKRRQPPEKGENLTSTPRKARKIAGGDAASQSTPPASAAATPSSRKKSILRNTPSKAHVNGTSDAEPTPKTLRRVLFSTPAKTDGENAQGEDETPTAVRNDRSARRKSARALQRQEEDGESEDDDVGWRDTALAEEILDAPNSDSDGRDEDEDEEIRVSTQPASSSNAEQPLKRGRGRPKGKPRERTPSPPPTLPPHELYFFQNRTGANKTSANTFPPQLLLNHEDYFTQIEEYKDTHEIDIQQLKQYHRRAFDQWMFEWDEGLNICLYGYGSKRDLVMDFAEHYCQHAEEKKPAIVVVNGYAPGLTIRDILTTLAKVVLPNSGSKIPSQPAALLEQLLHSLDDTPPSQLIRLLIHSMDHTNLRKASTQTLLARLAAHPSISLLATCDTPHFPLLWDTLLLRQFRWVYHDATTFQPYSVEIEVVEDVNALLGRSGRRLGGKDGVGYVLKSLTENARNLFRILVAEQLASSDADADPQATAGAAMNGFHDDDDDDDDILGAEDEEEAAMQQDTPSRRGRGRPRKWKTAKVVKPAVAAISEGIEYRTLYHKAVEEFVCSSELSFRELLREFHDHQMIDSRKDGLGTERLVVPFRREELETILEELV